MMRNKKTWVTAFVVLVLLVTAVPVAMHLCTSPFSFGNVVLLCLYAIFFCVMAYAWRRIRDTV